tara:strand:+ start:959 stop:1117 length:159 start_codon:yes stop_codon:yes gene_type:complete
MKKFFLASWAIIKAIYAIVGVIFITPIAVIFALTDIGAKKLSKWIKTFNRRN